LSGKNGWIVKRSPVIGALGMVLLVVVLAQGLAVPGIGLSVQDVGTGMSSVCSPSPYGGFYFMVDYGIFNTYITGVKMEFPVELPAGLTIYVAVTDSSGSVSTGNYTIGAQGLDPNTPVVVDIDPPIQYGDEDTVKVTLVGGKTNSTLSTITLTAQEIGTSSWSSSGTTVYAQPINITYTGTQDLPNWPVKVVLKDNGNGNDYINWNAIENNPDSIRFVDSSGRLLYYWIEILDTTDEYAVIWVNVTDVPPGGTHIWMLYGDNSDYSSYNNGHKVFPFFDDFETWSGWTKYKKGIVRQTDDNFEYGGSYAAEKDKNTDPNGAYKSLGRTFYDNNTYGGLIVEYWDKRLNPYTRGPFDRVGLIDDNGNGYGAVMIVRLKVNNRYQSQLRIDIRKGYYPTGTYAVKRVNPLLSRNTWYFVRFEIIPTSNGVRLVMRLYDREGNLVKTTWYTDSKYKYSQFTNVYIFGGYPYHIDALRVRYYTPDEPQAVVDEWYRYLPFEPTCS